MHPSSYLKLFEERLGDRANEFLIPPPVFEAMEGEVLQIDLDEGLLVTRFPVKRTYLNPYRTMQGGMVAAAVDNTFGPLSMLVAPPNVTRRFEMKYSRPIGEEVGAIMVQGRFLGRDGRRLFLTADVRDPDNRLLARAQATHWVLEVEDEA